MDLKKLIDAIYQMKKTMGASGRVENMYAQAQLMVAEVQAHALLVESDIAQTLKKIVEQLERLNDNEFVVVEGQILPGGLERTHADFPVEADGLKNYGLPSVPNKDDAPPIPGAESNPNDHIVYDDGEPCDHKGCRDHITHPCEGCGRIGAKGMVDSNGVIFINDGTTVLKTGGPFLKNPPGFDNDTDKAEAGPILGEHLKDLVLNSTGPDTEIADAGPDTPVDELTVDTEVSTVHEEPQEDGLGAFNLDDDDAPEKPIKD